MSDVEKLPNWYLREWIAFRKKRQSSLVNELGWQKARASKVWNDKNEYRREVVNEVSAWLEIEPFELLMPPSEAMALRALRDTAIEIARGSGPHLKAAEARAAWEDPPKAARAPARKAGSS